MRQSKSENVKSQRQKKGTSDCCRHATFLSPDGPAVHCEWESTSYMGIKSLKP